MATQTPSWTASERRTGANVLHGAVAAHAAVVAAERLQHRGAGAEVPRRPRRAVQRQGTLDDLRPQWVAHLGWVRLQGGKSCSAPGHFR